MKTSLSLVALSLTPLLAVSSFAQAPTAPKTPKEKLSYAIGMDIGSAIKKQNLEVDGHYLAAAVQDSVSGGQMQMTNEEMQTTLTDFSKQMQAKKADAGRAAVDAGKAYLVSNKAKPDVKTTADGLQYKVLKDGTGPLPKASDTVTVNYRGTLINGTEFDSSYKRNEPATFPVGGVIKGWTEALQLMKVGSKWQLVIPSELAYGQSGTPDGSIAPGSTLIFEVELLGIK